MDALEIDLPDKRMPTAADAEALLGCVRELWPAYGARMSVALAVSVLKRSTVGVDALMGLVRRHKEANLDSRSPSWEEILAAVPRPNQAGRYAKGDPHDGLRARMVKSVEQTGNPLVAELLEAEAAGAIRTSQLADWADMLEAGRRGFQYGLKEWTIADPEPVFVTPGRPHRLRALAKKGWTWPRQWCVRVRGGQFVPIEDVDRWLKSTKARLTQLVEAGPLSRRFISQACCVVDSELARCAAAAEKVEQRRTTEQAGRRCSQSGASRAVSEDDEVPF